MSNVNFKEDADENIKLLYEQKEYYECLNQYKNGNQSFKSSTFILLALAAVETRDYAIVRELISNFLALDGQPTLLVETLINKIKFVRELDDSKFIYYIRLLDGIVKFTGSISNYHMLTKFRGISPMRLNTYTLHFKLIQKIIGQTGLIVISSC